MCLNKIRKYLFIIFIIGFGALYSASFAYAQVEELPVRGYTSPEEVVTFDRTTSFQRALDVINRFAQKFTGKLIIDRSDYKGPIGISIPPMHWRDALELILNKHYLTLIERREYFEIVPYSPNAGSSGQAVAVTAVPDTGLTTHTKEIRIHAIFFEGNRTALQEIGVDWSTLTNNVPAGVGSFFGQGGGGGGGSGGGSGGGGSVSGQGGLPITGGAFSNGPFVNINSKGAKFVSQTLFNAVINLGEVFGSGVSVQALFSAFEAKNLGTVLASPSIRVLEGVTGKIQVGQDFAITQKDFAGNTITQFYSAGTILQVTPQVIEYRDTSFIHLNIKVERSTVVPSSVQTVINTQNATTQVLLLNGETTVIAGLYQTQMTKVRKGVPILKDLPAWFFGLRYLFGYTSKSYETRELIVLIQAELVPSIAQRIDKKLEAPFEVLQDKRLKIRRKVIEYRESIQYPDVLPTADPQNIFEKDHKLRPSDREPEEQNVRDNKEKEAVRQINGTERNKEENKIAEANESDKSTFTSRTFSDRQNAEASSGRQKLRYPDEEKREAAKTPDAVSQDAETSLYYIIGGSFKIKKNARQFKRRLERRGYDPEILVSVRSDFYMVSYRGFDSHSRASAYLSKIRRQTNKNAWLYRNL